MIKINNLNVRGMNDEFYILEEVNNTNICNFISCEFDLGETCVSMSYCTLSCRGNNITSCSKGMTWEGRTYTETRLTFVLEEGIL